MKTSKTNEIALEQHIERVLTGTTQEELQANIGDLQEARSQYLNGKGYFSSPHSNFNPKYAIDEPRFWSFLENTQAEELDKLQRHSDWKLRILERYDKMLKKYGLLRLLRKGLEVENAHFTLFYVAPLASSSQKVKERFAQNEFSIMRQVHYNLNNPAESIDMVLFINGISIATFELKNAWTGQTARYHAQKQYREDRDPKQPLLNFGRCLVHFAVDTDEVYMTTKLAGKSTFFLPFNKGNNNGKGNPVNPFGHKTAYLWEEILTKESLANIIQHFVRFDGKANDPLAKRTLFFPRYHQLDVVRKIIKHVQTYGVGHRYLIQHSAGSGKSNSITWAAYQLIETYPENAQVKGAKGLDKPLFDSVIVVTDRRLLDKQIGENIKEFSQVKNLVAKASSSKELRSSLEDGKRIIITTIQKFPLIVEGIADLSDKRFAVIIDEAHSSQGGSTAGKMNQALGQEENEEDAQDKILNIIKSRKMKGNASYLAFTATPKNSTLEKFGVRQEDGSFKPFHLYSMKQAIEEGFILDVLSNYTTHKSYYEIEKSILENPLFESKKAQKKLRQYVEAHKQPIRTKAETILEHFISKVFNTKKLRGKAKAMLICQSIEIAIRYYKTLKELLAKKGNPFEILIAFSGSKTVEGIEYTEAEMNGFAESDTRNKFEEDKYRILVVANKYLTGFDQPKLCTMYVDKRLQGVLAVQALSRLNRSAPKYGKKTEDLFVLDFFNTVEDIKTAFDPFYTSTTLSEATDVNVLHELKGILGDLGVYEWSEVEEFVDLYFEGVEAQKLSPITDRAAQRFNEELELEHKDKADFKIKAKQFVKIYGQMASIIPFEIPDWEKLFWFLKFLIPKLIVKSEEDKQIDDLLDSVDLSTYGLERSKLNYAIELDASESELEAQNPNVRGVHEQEKEYNPLDEIIKSFNERFFQGWEATPEEQRIKFESMASHVKQHKDYQSKVLDNQDPQTSTLAFEKILSEIMIKQRKQDMELYKQYNGDDTFKQAFLDTMMRFLMASPPSK